MFLIKHLVYMIFKKRKNCLFKNPVLSDKMSDQFINNEQQILTFKRVKAVHICFFGILDCRKFFVNVLINKSVVSASITIKMFCYQFCCLCDFRAKLQRATIFDVLIYVLI